MEDEAQKDLQEDFEELLYLYNSYINQLENFQKSFSKIKGLPSFDFVKTQTDFYISSFKKALKGVSPLTQHIRGETPFTKDRLIHLNNQKEIFYQNLRTKVGLIGALITSTDWQSPSFDHSISSQAGIQEGKILANISDYKRDRHLNEIEYQETFLKEYVDGFIKFPVFSYLTTSGMAALTTIITFLKLNKKVSGPVMMGKTIYFQNIELIKSFFQKEKIIEVEEMNTEKILETFDSQNPDLIIFDSICNAPEVAVPDLTKILKHIGQNAKKETVIILDNTTGSIAVQPLKDIFLKTKIKLFVFESLNKYHQFGMDRVTGGIVWMWGWELAHFNFAREHSGTNIIDSSCYVLPTPNKKFLQRRLLRFQRNAKFLSSSISEFVKINPGKKIAGAVYPGLENHPAYEWAKNYFFTGSYFVMNFQKKYQTVKDYQRFVKMVIDSAKKRKVSIIAGTSFGLNQTRIYLTAKDTTFGEPFVRVSVGTENRIELEKLKDVFTEVIKSF